MPPAPRASRARSCSPRNCALASNPAPRCSSTPVPPPVPAFRWPCCVFRPAISPFEFTLDDSLAMDASMSLSRFDEVVVLARISRSGGAMTQSGDLQGSSAVVPTVGSGPVTVVIDEVVP